MIISKQDRLTQYHNSGEWGTQRLHDLFEATAARFPERDALVDPLDKQDLVGSEPQRLTYNQLKDKVDQLTKVLLNNGLGKDDIILVQMPNVVELIFTYLAASRLGIILSPVPVQYQESELSTILNVLQPKAIVLNPEFKQTSLLERMQRSIQLAELQTQPPKILSWGEGGTVSNLSLQMTQSLQASLYNDYRQQHTISADDLITICWTSGTEGTPKGVPRSHNQWLAIGKATYLGNQIQDNETLLNPFPLINMASIGGMFLSWLYSGGKLVLHHPLNLPVFLQQIVTEKVNYTLAPPALLNTILKDEKLKNAVDFSTIRAIGSGSAPLDVWMVEGYKELFDIEIVNHFGSNEGMSLLCGPNETDRPEKRARLFPRASSLLETRLIDVETNQQVSAHDKSGELQIKGAGVFDGYYKSPEKTESCFTDDGFFKTGDLFQISSEDPVFYTFIGRCKDLIIRGGMNIAPAELDNLLNAHDDILDVAVAPYPCEILGERIAVFATLKPEKHLTLADVVNYLKQQNIASFKLPEKLILVNEIPRNPLGKVMRHKLSIAS
ncbi:class I adenylate-forming enzyme family protein [Aliiglaciecola sp. 2_MG-2023]|uniref:class I adenylate-forming enzyme family protein n=1 Tax=unclassified Aliiglaciecola TaxID=2593648 RepID=UPI0026E461AC|nr:MULTISPECIES: class I adenylate-forming enzyme family protein [unclassified Aliiglaciecola]MDO6711592.1 class I adenylate-forming enzyme family protein [Aliiglaciecola sp. 2_MG-2023]MDO6752663.1 class I adenylate-forming enzyme family protein [Aliiglaciecola sp. 1_MG-2023]